MSPHHCRPWYECGKQLHHADADHWRFTRWLQCPFVLIYHNPCGCRLLHLPSITEQERKRYIATLTYTAEFNVPSVKCPSSRYPTVALSHSIGITQTCIIPSMAIFMHAATAPVIAKSERVSMELTNNIGYGVSPPSFGVNHYDNDYACADVRNFYDDIGLRRNAAYRSNDLNEIYDGVL